MEIKANWVDLEKRRIVPVSMRVEAGKIHSFQELDQWQESFLLPGFIDAHVHIESSLLIPSEFARMATLHGTIATVSDPHEIANVCGLDGVELMIENGKKVPFYFAFGAPSCVPATAFETAGAVLNDKDIEQLLANKDIYYLAEMMNYPGVLYGDEQVHAKLTHAREAGKPIDGHAPGLMGKDAVSYFSHGISTDHECFSLEEGREKAHLGVNILIREGSAARNFEALIPLLREFPNQIMFCSDDKHPDSLLLGHINQLVARAVKDGYELFDVLTAACINPRKHYTLPSGALNPGDSADFIVVEDLRDFKVKETWIKGICVARNGQSLIPRVEQTPINQFGLKQSPPAAAFELHPKPINRVIGCLDGELITLDETLTREELLAHPDIATLVVLNRYNEAPPALAFIRGMGIQKGAMASTVAHDSHNIVAVGKSAMDIQAAIDALVQNQGGLSLSYDGITEVLPLNMAGLMSTADAWEVAEKYTQLDKLSKTQLGSSLRAPYMTLSFMALLVIPSLKLSDLGLFDGKRFEFVNQNQ